MGITLEGSAPTAAQIERYRLTMVARLARQDGRSLRQIARLVKRSAAWVHKAVGPEVSAADFPISHRPPWLAADSAPKK